MGPFKSISITVNWFDQLKGIGEGNTSDGSVVFLNAKFIIQESGFITLKPGETVSCEVQSLSDKPFASKIVREVKSKERIERATFLEPRPLISIPEPTV